MQTSVNLTSTENLDEELADVLTAISVVSKRIARKLNTLSQKEREKTEGGKSNEQNE